MNSDGSVDVLRGHILLLSNQLGYPSADWICMEDNATCYMSLVTNSFKTQTDIQALRWPARSVDLDPINNV